MRSVIIWKAYRIEEQGLIDTIELKYSVGALLYSPALNAKLADSILQGKFGDKYSVALCLEDTIAGDMVQTAEAQTAETVRRLYEASQTRDITLPKFFIRVREPEQMPRIYEKIKPYAKILTGFIFPKYSVSNAQAYHEQLLRLNAHASQKLWMMPIIESSDIVEPLTRNELLGQIREQVDSMREFVLNVRVGGNDFCNQFGVRRHYDETIYDILPIAQLLGDILTFFSRDYVVSGPVWEFFASANDEWRRGLRNELKMDKLNGFIGKTVIHPKQIPIVNEMLKVSCKDYEDACAILNWDSSGLQVGKSFGGERMNEVRTHYNWARKIVLLSELYGVI
ncbi:MAG: HpcH/HpaI aldolase/citrate lyase family protein [Oscillospiraceae bacterium]|nr:HpcH/HpaI aldolase/citrate lyase family protein [Oscillospiraceae bacterium]